MTKCRDRDCGYDDQRPFEAGGEEGNSFIAVEEMRGAGRILLGRRLRLPHLGNLGRLRMGIFVVHLPEQDKYAHH